MSRIELSEEVDFDRIGELWRDLEARADGSFFQSWAWVGCLASERFPNPVLLQAREGGVAVALGLFNRRRRLGGSDLLLNESGIARFDSVFVEHNGFLIERDRAAGSIAECLEAVIGARGRRPRRVVLSGIPESYLAALRHGPYPHAIRATRAAPFVDLRALRQQGEGYLDRLSANTRYQLRRSRRRYEAAGELSLRRAESIAETRDFLGRLAELHQRYWTGRGRPGAFANADFRRFHDTLIDRAFASGAIDLMRVSAGGQAIGYLYNLRYRGTVYAYQSGFDYAASDAQRKPGLTCHHLAIERYLAEGAERYDFLAGGDRYKLSLSTGAATLYWLEIGPRRRLAAVTQWLGALARKRFRDGERRPAI
ncbi:MAG TPA: GNAT family N-acetyltransferase [Stellaceae bacterium]|nr:GNAT family N-acetyltransferase [Stellaceae bacterium]